MVNAQNDTASDQTRFGWAVEGSGEIGVGGGGISSFMSVTRHHNLATIFFMCDVPYMVTLCDSFVRVDF